LSPTRRPSVTLRVSIQTIEKSEEPKAACQRKPTAPLALSSSERRHKEPLAHLPTALRPSRPGQQWIFHQAEEELTSLPVVRYSSGHRKGRLKILSIILEISGGGAKGAFGSGVLVGWAESGTRPKFDIVTGISAGALLSTFAFLGEPEDDGVIADLFTGMKKDDVSPKAGGVLRFAFGDNSLMDNQPLIEMLRKLITEKTLDRVAAEARKGRLLFVGLLNLDYRQLWAFDLTGLAASGEADAVDTIVKFFWHQLRRH
jgi:Patatin-like phospholipase